MWLLAASHPSLPLNPECHFNCWCQAPRNTVVPPGITAGIELVLLMAAITESVMWVLMLSKTSNAFFSGHSTLSVRVRGKDPSVAQRMNQTMFSVRKQACTGLITLVVRYRRQAGLREDNNKIRSGKQRSGNECFRVRGLSSRADYRWEAGAADQECCASEAMRWEDTGGKSAGKTGADERQVWLIRRCGNEEGKKKNTGRKPAAVKLSAIPTLGLLLYTFLWCF